MKTGDVQLSLASAVIPMPGACVLPTTTSRSSAAAADGSGRGSNQPGRFKGESRLQVSQGARGCLPAAAPARAVAAGERGWDGMGWDGRVRGWLTGESRWFDSAEEEVGK